MHRLSLGVLGTEGPPTRLPRSMNRAMSTVLMLTGANRAFLPHTPCTCLKLPRSAVPNISTAQTSCNPPEEPLVWGLASYKGRTLMDDIARDAGYFPDILTPPTSLLSAGGLWPSAAIAAAARRLAARSWGSPREQYEDLSLLICGAVRLFPVTALVSGGLRLSELASLCWCYTFARISFTAQPRDPLNCSLTACQNMSMPAFFCPALSALPSLACAKPVFLRDPPLLNLPIHNTHKTQSAQRHCRPCCPHFPPPQVPQLGAVLVHGCVPARQHWINASRGPLRTLQLPGYTLFAVKSSAEMVVKAPLRLWPVMHPTGAHCRAPGGIKACLAWGPIRRFTGGCSPALLVLWVCLCWRG